MCEGNQEGLTARIWQTTTLICFFTFLYVYVRRFMCVQIHVGGGGGICVQVHVEARLWFLGCHPLILGWSGGASLACSLLSRLSPLARKTLDPPISIS